MTHSPCRRILVLSILVFLAACAPAAATTPSAAANQIALSPSPTHSPTASEALSPSPTPASTLTPTPALTPTSTPTPTKTATLSPTSTFTASPTRTRTLTPRPTATTTATPVVVHPGCIPYTEAGDHLGERMCVWGVVFSTYNSGKAFFINFDDTRTAFYGVAFRLTWDGLEKRCIEITGKIEPYQGRAEIIIGNRNQVVDCGG